MGVVQRMDIKESKLMTHEQDPVLIGPWREVGPSTDESLVERDLREVAIPGFDRKVACLELVEECERMVEGGASRVVVVVAPVSVFPEGESKGGSFLRPAERVESDDLEAETTVDISVTLGTLGHVLTLTLKAKYQLRATFVSSDGGSRSRSSFQVSVSREEKSHQDYL